MNLFAKEKHQDKEEDGGSKQRKGVLLQAGVIREGNAHHHDETHHEIEDVQDEKTGDSLLEIVGG